MTTAVIALVATSAQTRSSANATLLAVLLVTKLIRVTRGEVIMSGTSVYVSHTLVRDAT